MLRFGETIRAITLGSLPTIIYHLIIIFHISIPKFDGSGRIYHSIRCSAPKQQSCSNLFRVMGSRGCKGVTIPWQFCGVTGAPRNRGNSVGSGGHHETVTIPRGREGGGGWHDTGATPCGPQPPQSHEGCCNSAMTP